VVIGASFVDFLPAEEPLSEAFATRQPLPIWYPFSLSSGAIAARLGIEICWLTLHALMDSVL
jgi:hypothetical protein